MKHLKQIMSAVLVLAMLAGCVVAFSLTSSAANTVEDPNKDGTLPKGAEVSTETASGFSGGDGTEADPYQIKDVEEFRYFQSQINADSTYLEKSYVLTGNIYYNAKLSCLDADGFPIATYNSGNRYSAKSSTDNTTCAVPGTFSGTFDGAGYGIYNTFMRYTEGGGFFETVTGTVKNLNLYGGFVLFQQTNIGGSLIKTLSGGTVSNCYSSVGIATTTKETGGIVGTVLGVSTIENCVYAGAIKHTADSEYATGGIAGRVDNATLTISGCKNYAPIVSGSARLGGIVGFFVSSTCSMSNCANYGNIYNTSTKGSGGVGGIVGRNHSSNAVNLSGCANYGDITADSTAIGRAGGIIGETAGTKSIVNCANYGDVTGYAASGIIPYAIGATISNCYSEGTLKNLDSKQASYILAGYVRNTTTVQNCVGVVTTTRGLSYTGDSTTVASNNATYLTGAAALTDGTALAILNTDNAGVWVQGATAPELAPQIKVDGATLTLGAEMTLKFFVKSESLTEIAENLNTIAVTAGEKSYAGTLNADGNYEFEVTDLAAKDFATDVTYKVQYTLKDDTANLITCTDGISYSPVTYATRMYNKADAAQTHYKNLLVALVQYASVAAADSKTEEDETATILANFKTATGYVFPEAGYGDYAAIKAIDGASTFTYAENASGIADMGASLTGSLNLILTQKNVSYTAVTAKIGEAELEVVKSDGTWVIKGLYASDLYNEITFTFTGDGVAPVVATYSVARFLSNYGGDYAALAQATAIYMDAAYAYASGN